MSINFSLLFYLNKPKNYQTGPVPVYLRVTVAGKRAELTTSRSVEPERWISSAGLAKGTKAAAKSLNTYLDNLQAKVYEAHRQLVEAGLPLTAEAIKNKFLGKEEKGRTLVEVFSEHNSKVAALVGDELPAGFTFDQKYHRTPCSRLTIPLPFCTSTRSSMRGSSSSAYGTSRITALQNY
ncbi:Arm DNA-binding domain-containing protein [Pontibacter mangrovi]|uniref:Arm DNA-binding domain-containing protein n=1 Tax=Pontibacter mangrovi TaxID=2589816 RepID=A0A501VWK4_9BACT|nr:Arm DNA-binding domain-containing protein [Pontibacter mangrovi]TPE42103.1 hypothetical protein FJM65_18630 [Pontibacter mangrovi]